MTTHFTFTAHLDSLFNMEPYTVPVNPKVTLLDNDDYDALEDYLQADNDAAYWYLLDNLHGMGVDYDLTDNNIFGIHTDDTPRVMLYLYRNGVDLFVGSEPFSAKDWQHWCEVEDDDES